MKEFSVNRGDAHLWPILGEKIRCAAHVLTRTLLRCSLIFSPNLVSNLDALVCKLIRQELLAYMGVCGHFEESFRENAAVIADSYGGLINYKLRSPRF